MNKFLKLLLLGLAVALLPGCDDDKKKSGSTDTGTGAGDEDDTPEVTDNPDFVNFFKLFETDKRPLTITLDGVALIPPVGGAAEAGFAATDILKITAADAAKLASFAITGATAANNVQAIGTTEAADNASLNTTLLAGFSFSFTKTGDVPSITVTTPANWGKGVTGNGATGAQNAVNLGQRSFVLLLDSKLTGSATSLSGTVNLRYTVSGKTSTVPVKIAIASA